MLSLEARRTELLRTTSELNAELASRTAPEWVRRLVLAADQFVVERAIPESRIYSPVGLVQQFDRAITAELDFTTEGENAARK